SDARALSVDALRRPESRDEADSSALSRRSIPARNAASDVEVSRTSREADARLPPSIRPEAGATAELDKGQPVRTVTPSGPRRTSIWARDAAAASTRTAAAASPA